MGRYLVIFIWAITFGQSCSVKSQQPSLTTLYLLRHAEKAKDGGEDPALNELGKQRAMRLMELLEEVDFKTIYATDFLRTKNTVAPLADSKNMSIEIYNAHDKDFLQEILVENSNDNYLIVGHSNTIPGLVNYLTGKEDFQQLDENEYDKLFVVNLVELGVAKVQVLKF
ncbi:phosphoglycerate mutase family protein [Fulvivirgaceae bacterium BMA12]|uniref:Phosphoglycerate mutase family protein n=1 Tax=Agaribacillus aureus TaxID=3051825 RepID=A0ABT8LB68_9BACT|nr:phosphoglycerate mutase family protein [Fulvivirgaceae bacterium BMA12]